MGIENKQHFLQAILKLKKQLRIKVIKIITIKKNLNLTLRPYMVQKLII